MAYKNHAEEILDIVEAISQVKSVTRGWPADFSKLPCIAVSEAGNAPERYYADKEYLSKVEYYVRIFSKNTSLSDTIAAQVDALLTEQDWERTFAYEDDNPEVRQKIMRYKKEV